MNIQDPKIDKTLVVDSAANNKLALKLSGSFSGVLCSIHILQRAVVTVLNNNAFPAVRKCINVSKAIQKSPAKKDLLKKACTEVNCDYILPKIPVPTRWNSLFYCLKSTLKLSKALRYISINCTDKWATVQVN